MNKSGMIDTLAAEKGISIKKAEVVVNTLFKSMSEALFAGERIEIRGFGSFVVNEYKAYTGRNPKTGKSIAVKPKKLPFFKVGKDLKLRIMA